MIINRDDISKFNYFDKKGIYYFDFIILINNIIDIILYMNYLYINDDKR